MPDPVAIRAHFERFPATVKGAFVLRGADGDPHQVQIRGARVKEVGGASSRPLDLQSVTLDVAPNIDLFVPFEFATTELGSGWYGLECDVAVDGRPETVSPGKRFPIPWPRATVRRGTIPIGKSVKLDRGERVQIEHVECSGDSIRVAYTAPKAVDLRLSGDGVRVPVLESDFDAERGRVTAYPLLKTHTRLTIEVRGGAGSVDVPLP